jgi:hypothetical protein
LGYLVVLLLAKSWQGSKTLVIVSSVCAIMLSSVLISLCYVA